MRETNNPQRLRGLDMQNKINKKPAEKQKHGVHEQDINIVEGISNRLRRIGET